MGACSSKQEAPSNSAPKIPVASENMPGFEDGIYDVRDEFGKWVKGEVTRLRGSQLHVHFPGWSSKWDAKLDLVRDRDRLAPEETYTKKGTSCRYVIGQNIAVLLRKPKKSSSFVNAKVKSIDGKQFRVVYTYKEKTYEYWYHQDTAEILGTRPSKEISNTFPHEKKNYGRGSASVSSERNESKRKKQREKKESKQSRRIYSKERYGEDMEAVAKRVRDHEYPEKAMKVKRHEPSSSEESEEESEKYYTAPYAAPKKKELERKQLAGDKGKLCCDRCNGKHLTSQCPIYKKPRPKHKDAWVNKGRKTPLSMMGSSGGDVRIRDAKVYRQPGDGNCLFHSLGYGLGTNAYRLRQEICRFISRNPNLEIGENCIYEWVEYASNKSVRGYASYMSRSGIWGGGLEIASCAHMKQVSIHVWKRSGWNGGFKRISCFEVKGARKVVNILYSGGVHYDALVRYRD
mmetsp:Transcript_18125/g.27185  ORF Transcript_18125/g.27185 Transcript_18125/m.27185 type:complete len:459 (-) Transcript_18125:43-1419(-)